MSFYGIETGLTAFPLGRKIPPESRAEIDLRIASKLAELIELGILADDDDRELVAAEWRQERSAQNG
jgi:hypothetical protein